MIIHLQLSAMGGSQDVFRSQQSATAESIRVGQVEEQGDVPGELLLLGNISVKDISIGAARVACDNPPEDREVLEEGRGLPDRRHSLPIYRSNVLAEGSPEDGAQNDQSYSHFGSRMISIDTATCPQLTKHYTDG